MNYDKENIYDLEIAPLMSKIIEVCKANDIPMIASYCFKVGNNEEESEDLCTTFIPQNSGWTPESFEDCRKRLFRKSSFMAFTITKT